MSAPKNAGSLTAGLLARKGAAQPAMRRQPVSGLTSLSGPRAVSPLDDLGWNDMGEEAEPTPAPAPSPVAAHIAAIQETLDRRQADRRAEASVQPAPPLAPVAVPVPVAAPVAHKKPAPERKPQSAAKSAFTPKSAFTLRIDAERHLRLRLLSAVTNRSAQQLLTGALDALLAQHPNIAALAASPALRSGDGATDTE